MVGVVEQVPIVHVHQDGHRLTEDQRQPHDDVAGTAALEQLVGEHAERDLTEHPVEGPEAEHVQRNGHLKRFVSSFPAQVGAYQVLVKEGRNREDRNCSAELREPVANHWLVEMTHGPAVHGNVPRLPEVGDSLSVPEIPKREEVTLQPTKPLRWLTSRTLGPRNAATPREGSSPSGSTCRRT